MMMIHSKFTVQICDGSYIDDDHDGDDDELIGNAKTLEIVFVDRRNNYLTKFSFSKHLSTQGIREIAHSYADLCAL